MSLMLAAAVAANAPNYIPSSPDLGVAEGRCRPNESGPAFQISIEGLKDRKGRLKVELYPNDDAYFVKDDNVVLMAGKPFRRAEIGVPQSGPVTLCIRAPGPGSYSMMVLHDRDSNRKFGLSVDGGGFPNNPRIRLGLPSAQDSAATVGNGPKAISITMQYRTGLFSFGPLKK